MCYEMSTCSPFVKKKCGFTVSFCFTFLPLIKPESRCLILLSSPSFCNCTVQLQLTVDTKLAVNRISSLKQILLYVKLNLIFK
jgi:hypothetical protein